MFDDLSGKEILEQFKTNKKLKITTYVVLGVAVLISGYLIYGQFKKHYDQESSDAVAIWHNKASRLLDNEMEYRLAFTTAEAELTDDQKAKKAEFDKVFKEGKKLVDEWNGYKGGEVAQYAVARLMMVKKDFKNALEQLEDVDLEDTYGPIGVKMLMGDCYSEMKKYKEAGDMYLEASEINPNEALTPLCLMKAGACAEEAKDYKTALTCYQKIKDEYGTTPFGRDIDKYIGKVEGKQ